MLLRLSFDIFNQQTFSLSCSLWIFFKQNNSFSSFNSSFLFLSCFLSTLSLLVLSLHFLLIPTFLFFFSFSILCLPSLKIWRLFYNYLTWKKVIKLKCTVVISIKIQNKSKTKKSKNSSFSHSLLTQVLWSIFSLFLKIPYFIFPFFPLRMFEMQMTFDPFLPMKWFRQKE